MHLDTKIGCDKYSCCFKYKWNIKYFLNALCPMHFDIKFGCDKYSFCLKYRWDFKYSLNEQFWMHFVTKFQCDNLHFALNIGETLNIPIMSKLYSMHFWSCLFVPYMVLHQIIFCVIFHVLKIICQLNLS
jgi:hypothetical protein